MRDADVSFELDLHGEPTLDDLMADPIFHALMRRDGLNEAGVREVVARAAARVRQGQCGPEA